MSASSEIIEFFTDKVVFLTGATGFIGKLTLERLLRVCRVRTVYILVRAKKGKCGEERCKDLFNEVVFEKLRNECPNYQEHIKVITGDCMGENLNISDEDWALLHTQVEVIIHCAASVQFNLDLRSAFNSNVRCVRDLIINARQMQNLKSFVHVSTAYSNCFHHKTIEERTYAPPMTAEQLEFLLETFPDDFIENIEKSILHNCPNTYIFTKCIAEEMIERMSHNMDHRVSISIVRPSIVTSTYQEPFCGWVDNKYGPIGVTLGVALGLVHTMPMAREMKADMVPGDYVVNAILAVAWNTGNKGKDVKLEERSNFEVYNYTSNRHSISWGKYLPTVTNNMGIIKYYCCAHVQRFISNNILWIPFCWYPRYKWINDLQWFFVYTLPAYGLDTLLKCYGRRPKFVKVYKKIRENFDVLVFFSFREWDMPHKKISKLFDALNEEDRKQFELRISTLNWHEYYNPYLLGLREHVLKESMSNIKIARRRFKKLRVLSYILKGIAIIFCCWILHVLLNLLS